MVLTNRCADEVVAGVRDFHGLRLHFLQIGLGTFGTVIENLVIPDEAYDGVTWLLDAASDSSTGIRCAGVEPVREHVERLRPLLNKLPNAALVEAAMVREGQEVTMHAVTQEEYLRCLRAVSDENLASFEDSMTFLRNMSCVGQAHPDVKCCTEAMEVDFGVTVTMETIKARAVTYGSLVDWLNFNGVEVLMIDAEGHDCQILHSVIEFCSRSSDDQCWPQILQFETMGHCDRLYGAYSEEDMLRWLDHCGYIVVCRGKDTQLVKESALDTEVRLQDWLKRIRCEGCWASGMGWGCLPFTSYSGVGAMCKNCACAFNTFGCSAWEWTALNQDPNITSIATDGTWLWGLTVEGQVCYHSNDCWKIWPAMAAGRAFVHVSLSASEVWGVDRDGSVLRHSATTDGPWTPLSGSPKLVHLAVTPDGREAWGIDESRGIHVYLAAAKQWRNLGGRFEYLAISADGLHIWGLSDGDIYYRHGLDDEWTQIWGSLVQIAVSSDGSHVWGVNCWGELFYRAGLHGNWVWIPGKLKQVCISSNGRTAWGRCRESAFWLCNL